MPMTVNSGVVLVSGWLAGTAIDVDVLGAVANSWFCQLEAVKDEGRTRLGSYGDSCILRCLKKQSSGEIINALPDRKGGC